MLKLLLTASLTLCLPPPLPSTANLKYNEIERYDEDDEDDEDDEIEQYDESDGGDEDDENLPNEV